MTDIRQLNGKDKKRNVYFDAGLHSS